MTDFIAGDGRLHAVERWTLGLGAAVSVASFIIAGRELGLAVSLGAGIMSLNAIAMRRVGEKIWSSVRAESGARPFRAIILFNLKMGGLIAAVYCVVKYLHVHPIGLLVGLSVYPLAAVAVALTYVPAEGVPPALPPATSPAEDHHG